jgi:hypothetical protein
MSSLVRTHVAGAVLLALLARGATAQFDYTVTNLNGSGPGSLHDALQALNLGPTPTATITLGVAGTVLQSIPLPYTPQGTALWIRAGFASGRFTIDARPASGGNPIYGLHLRGPGSVVSAPLTILVQQGAGLTVTASACRVEDLEIVGGSQNGLLASSAHDLVVQRLRVTGTGGYGVGLYDSDRARFGDAGTSSFVQVRDRTMLGFLIQGGSGVAVECFDIAGCAGGLQAINTSVPRIGTAAGPRCTASDNNGGGVVLQGVFGQQGFATLQNADLHRNAWIGVHVDGGRYVTVADCACDRNVARGASVEGSAMDVAFERVTCSNSGGGLSYGVYVGAVTRMVVRDCTMGPGNQIGFASYASGANTGLSIVGGSARDNTVFGARLEQVAGVTIDGLFVAENITAGIFGVNLVSCVIKNCTVAVNQGTGINASACPGLVIGPGNVVDYNLVTGIWLIDCQDARIADNPSISHNRLTGIYLYRCHRARIHGATLTGNTGLGLSILTSDDSVVGPGVVVEGTLGTGVKFEIGRNATLESCKIVRSEGSALSFVMGGGQNLVRSCLIAENRDLGITLRSAPPTDVVCCTIAGNHRGVSPGNPYGSGPTIVRLDSCILRANRIDDFGNHDPYGLVTAKYSFLQNPLPGANNPERNSAADPVFASEAAGDWRLAPFSPAVDACDPALSFPGNAQDAGGGVRSYGARPDCGAFESQPSTQVLSFFPDKMQRPGGHAYFSLQWPASEAGKASVVLFNLAGPGILPLWSLQIPLAYDAWMGVCLHMGAPFFANTIVPSVPGNGSIVGAVDYSSLPLLPSIAYPLRIWASAFTYDAANGGSLAANATFVEIR